MASDKNILLVPCPACGTGRHVARSLWSSTLDDTPRWNAKKQEYIRNPGPEMPIECFTCDDAYPAKNWHRAYERTEFRKKGWVTPAMLKEGTI